DLAPIARRLEVAGELLAIARAVDDRPRQLRAHARAAMDRAELGDLGRFGAHVDEMLSLSLAVGHPRHRWRALLMASRRAVAERRCADSERFTGAVEQTAAMVDEPALGVSLFAHVSERDGLFHRDDAIRARLAQLSGNIPESPLRAITEAAVRANLHTA